MANVETFFRQAFSDDIRIAAQQMTSFLKDKVINERLSAEKKFFDNYGAVAVREKTDRNGEHVYDDPTRNRRMITPRHFAYSTLISKNDAVRLETMAEPNGQFMNNLRYSLARQCDQLIIDAFDGTAYAGKDGTTATVFDTGQDITSNSGLTLDAVLNASQLLDDANVPEERRCIVVAPKQIRDVLSLEKFTSADYNSAMALMNSGISTFMGYTWIKSTLLGGVAASAPNYCYAWGMDAMIFGQYPETEVEIDIIPERQHGTQVAVYLTAAATRQYENQIVRINVDYAP